MTLLRDVTVIEHIWIPMPDGTRLAARIWMPERKDAQRCPAIFEYIPYRKGDMVRARDERNHPWLAAHGYVCLRVDMRGSGDSEGQMPDMYSDCELADARHVITWIADQKWSNGCVGMFGTSWGGTAGLQASIDPPDALKAVIAVCATHDRYEDDIHHMGGALLTDSLEWGATLPSILALPPSPVSGADWYERWMERMEQLAFPVEAWVRNEARGTYWRHGSVKHQAHRIGCPVLCIGGWSDRYSNSVMQLVDACSQNVWGIVGPWGHHYPDHGHPGPAIGFQQTSLEWWDHWLKEPDPDTPAWPKLRTWLREFDPPQDAIDERAGAWVQSGAVSEETSVQTRWLGNEGSLTFEPEHAGASWRVPSDLRHGLAAGDTGYFGRFGGLPLEQSEDDDRSLCFETPWLDEDVIVYGAPNVTLTVSAEEARRQLCLRLSDVSAEGVSSRVVFAVLNLALDDKLDAPETPMESGARTVDISFPTTAYRFKAGHKIRLAIAASSWPLVWPSPDVDGILIHDGRLDLPVFSQQPEALHDPFPPALAQRETTNFESLSAPRLKRKTEDHPDGSFSVSWHQPKVSMRHNDIDTTFSYETRALHSMDPNEPTSAHSVFCHEMQTDRPDGSATVSGKLTTTCTSSTYRLCGKLIVKWRGVTVFERTWDQSIDRLFS